MSNAIKNAMVRQGVGTDKLLVTCCAAGVLSMLLAVAAVCVHSPAILGVACAIGLGFMLGTISLVMLKTGLVGVKPETASPPRPRRFYVPVGCDLAGEMLESCTREELEATAASLRETADRLNEVAQDIDRRAKGGNS